MEAKLTQAISFQTQPEYDHLEHFVCTLRGTLQVRLVPHIFRQEVYTGVS